MAHQELGPNFLVIGDVHGEREMAQKALQLAEDYGATPVFLGDVMTGGRDTKGTIDAILSFGREVVAIVGNHEWTYRNALHSPSVEASVLARDIAWGNDPLVLKSYGLEREGRVSDALRLRRAMEEAGHWDWLENLPPFFETNQFIALHSGPLPDASWQEQRKDLLRESAPGARLYEEPLQIVDPSHKLSDLRATPDGVDRRLFVTGHNHLSADISRRRAQGRICVGSMINEGQPLFAWESITDRLHAIRAV